MSSTILRSEQPVERGRIREKSAVHNGSLQEEFLPFVKTLRPKEMQRLILMRSRKEENECITHHVERASVGHPLKMIRKRKRPVRSEGMGGDEIGTWEGVPSVEANRTNRKKSTETSCQF